MSVQVANSGALPQNDNRANTEVSLRSAAYDPVDKLRISAPQSLIDTDFEYGVQPTKWESVYMQNNRQSCYYSPNQPLSATGVTSITGDNVSPRSLVTVLASNTGGMVAGQPVFVQSSLSVPANGWYRVESITANVSFTYYAGGQVSATNQYNPAQTFIYPGYFYSNCGIQLTGTSAITAVGTTVTVTTTNPHGLSYLSLIYLTGLTGTNPPNGAWTVTSVPTANTFTFTSILNASAIVNAAGTTNLFARPTGGVQTRPFDGGVSFTAGANVPNAQLIRQTRRYFRYQSGKGIQFSTGSSMKPPIQVQGVTATGQIVTVTTQEAHNLAINTVITMTGAVQTVYNGNFTILTVPSLTTFTYQAVSPPTVSPATTVTGFRLTPASWYGSANRVGIFDQQNGLFFEFDGQTLFAVRRSSTQQISGSCQPVNGSSSIVGLNTSFATQLNAGDFVVIRGQSYRVINVASNTQMYVSPEYRGASYSGSAAGGFRMSLTVDTKVPQSQWFDKCDGNGPSGYVLDLSRMQMWYIDYSWYGAGTARFGFRGVGGAVTYVTAFQHNNREFEAYMRSGNLPAHYESNGLAQETLLTANLLSTSTTLATPISVLSTVGFPPQGTLKISNAGITGSVEYVNYAYKNDTTFFLATSGRAQTGGAAAAQNFIYTVASQILVEYAAPDSAVALNHWGSSVIMDGRFDDDKSLLFNYGTLAVVAVAAGAQVPILALRIGPSADTGQIGLLGIREIVNHMQLQVVELGVVTTGTFLINVVLNGFCTGFTGSFTTPILGNQITSSLAQIAVNTSAAATITGGESAAAFYTNPTGQTTLDLSQVRDIGNSILGGGTVNTIPTNFQGFYPDGPDILYVVATNTTAVSRDIQARLTWTEAQA